MRGKQRKTIFVDPDRVIFTPRAGPGPHGGYGSWILTMPGAPVPLVVDIDPVPTYDCDHRFESRGYQPSDKLRHLTQVRDGKCSFPACTRHARDCDYRHAAPSAKGGRTCACNAHCASRSCHRAKQTSGWTVTKPRTGLDPLDHQKQAAPQSKHMALPLLTRRLSGAHRANRQGATGKSHVHSARV